VHHNYTVIQFRNSNKCFSEREISWRTDAPHCHSPAQPTSRGRARTTLRQHIIILLYIHTSATNVSRWNARNTAKADSAAAAAGCCGDERTAGWTGKSLPHSAVHAPHRHDASHPRPILPPIIPPTWQQPAALPARIRYACRLLPAAHILLEETNVINGVYVCMHVM